MTTYTFDARNRLTQAGDTIYTYDAAGNRTSLVENNQETSYVIDPESALSQVLEKTGPNGQTDYVYGLGLIGQQDIGGYKTYHCDFRGNTVALTDIDGNITDSYQYDSYGNVTCHSGTTSTPFLYDGKDGVMADANGLIYMRARYYSPDTKRFISRDSVLGSITNPQTLDNYSYVNNNPVHFIDPRGHDVEENEEEEQQDWGQALEALGNAENEVEMENEAEIEKEAGDELSSSNSDVSLSQIPEDESVEQSVNAVPVEPQYDFTPVDNLNQQYLEPAEQDNTGSSIKNVYNSIKVSIR
jgi:RHS repeat-associated protein